MKKLLLGLVCTAFFVQHGGAQEKVATSSYARLYVGAIEPQYQLWMWHDVPYYKDNWGIIKCSIDRVRSGKDIYKGDLMVFKGQMPEPIKGCQYTINIKSKTNKKLF